MGDVIAMDERRFDDLVGAALDQVPEELIGLLDNVVMFVQDDPPAADPHLLGLYEGVPLTERNSAYGAALPDRITVYRNSILAICHSEADVVREVRTTVLHEIGHHFGLDDQRLGELGHA